MGIIYCYTNKLNGKHYIGQTIHPEQRKRSHVHEAIKRGSDYYFHRAIRKHGIENFTYQVLEETDNLNEREVFHIQNLNTIWPNGYNQTLEPCNMSETVKAKISTSQKIRLAKMDPKRRQEIDKKRANSIRGFKQTEYQKKRVSETMAKKWKLIDPEGNIHEITNLRQFGISMGWKSTDNLISVASGRLKHYKGWKAERIIG